MCLVLSSPDPVAIFVDALGNQLIQPFMMTAVAPVVTEGIAARRCESLLLDKQQEVLSRPTGAMYWIHRADAGLP